MNPAASRLRAAFVAAYRPYVVARLVELELPPPEGLDRAIAEGERWLEGRLTDLLATPFGHQDRSPLEVFQEAMRFPTQALRDTGSEPVARDPVAVNALPGDAYDLAPASSAALGDDAWSAHLAWGAQKAAAAGPARPTAVTVSGNLMDRTRIDAAIRARGWEPVAYAPDAASKPSVAFVDLSADASDAAISALVSAGARVIAYGPHVDDLALARARSLGAHEAVPRSRFFARLNELLPPIA